MRALPHVWALNPNSNVLALDHLSRAIEIEPDYPLALAVSAWCQAQKVIYLWTPMLDKARAEALRLARLAGDMKNDDPMVLTMLCAAYSVVSNLEIASALIKKALALDPNSAFAWNRSAWLNNYFMRPEVAIEQFQRAIRLSPFDPMNFNCLFGVGAAHWVAGRHEEALLWIRKGVLEHPPMVAISRIMAACLVRLGRISEAREVVRQIREDYPTLTTSKVVATVPLRDADFVRLYVEDLRKAGLPE